MAEIDRIGASELGRLWPDYVLANRPVIIRDLIVPTRGFEALLERFADVEVPPDPGEDHSTIADVLAKARRGEKFTAQGLPRLQLDRSEFLTRADAIEEVLTTADRKAVDRIGSLVFYGCAGDTTLLHVDGWVAATLQYQLAGSKEWFLAAPQTSALLMPIGQRTVVDAMALPRAKRAQLAELVDGYSFVVEAGETLYFPQQWVHGTHYDTHSFAVNEHVGRNLYGNFFAREVHPSLARHGVLQRLFPAERAEQHRDAFLIVHEACKREDGDAATRARTIWTAVCAAYDRVFPEAPFATLPAFVDQLEQQAIARAIGAPTLVARSEQPFYPEQVAGNRETWQHIQGVPLFDWW